uniref:Uncharacterized protein n=1 Tax=Zonotrichia albicollis TaxID=44394 RepID=A0A8D2QBC6_ZONAL
LLCLLHPESTSSLHFGETRSCLSSRTDRSTDNINVRRDTASVSLSSGSASCKLSASTTCSVAVADSAGCPWSLTTATSRCLAASRSPTARAVRTSPLCSPTRNSAGSDACTSSYDSHALRPASASTATTLATR